MSACKKILFVFISAFLALMSTPGQAASYMKTGLVVGVYAEDAISGGSTTIGIAGFVASDVNYECPTIDGMVALKVKNDEAGKQQFNILLASHLAGKKVRVRVNTSQKINGNCYISLVERMDY